MRSFRTWSLLLLLLSSVLPAFVVNRDPHALAQAAVIFAEGHIPSDTVGLENANPSLVANYAAYQNFMGRYGTGWSIFLDGQTGRPGYIGGEGIPMVPGLGNALTMGDIRLLDAGPRKKPTVQDVDALVRNFFAENAGLFQVDDPDLVLLPESGFYGDGDYLCFLNYQLTHQSIPVEGAILQARLNHGNLVDMGFAGNYARPAIPALASLSVQDAMGALGRHIGGFRPDDMFLQAGALKFVPTYLGEGKPFGRRVGHHLVYEFAFQRADLSALWRGWVDAHSGRVIKFEDATDYATYQRIRARVYPEHIGGGSSLVERSLAYTREENFDLCSTTSGLYPYPGGTVKCTLNMTEHPTGGCTYAWTNEMCGTKPSLTSSTGDLNFGGTTAQDCNYTGASYGNATEAGIMGLYHVTIEKVTALTYLPSNTWLNNTLEFESNYNSQCNANWDGTDLTMYRSGSTGGSACNNSGLIAGIFLHEFGHGLDANDGLASTDRGSGEAYGDSCGMIQTQNSCIGDYFWASDRNCGPNAGYGNQCNNCGGVRELNYAAKARNTPSTVKNWVCTDCWSSSYSDPCGYEGHCTSAGMGEAMWDLPVRDLTGVSGMSAATAWERFARIFYLSRPTSGKFYECSTASLCSNWTSNGCQSANWYRTLRVVDDDNGNLCDGTPNAAAIYAAFNRHLIACPPGGSCPNENKNVSSCPSLAAPTLGNPSAGACQISLSWTDTTNATQYHIYRNEFGCNANFIRIATVADPQITYTDTDVSPGVTYYYMVQAATANAACTGAMSSCKSATPSDCTTCVIPNAPTGVSCSGGSNQILVSWTAPSGTHDGYRVYRQKSGEFTWANVSGNLGLVTSWTDSNLLCATDYRYKVVSFETTNGPCESADSALTSYCQGSCGGCTAPGAPTLNSATGTCTAVDLSWSAGSGTTLSYNVYRVAGACGGSYSKIAGPITATTYSDTSAVAGTQYAYVVRGACDSTGATESANSNCLTATRLATPAAPTGLSATGTCTAVDLSWTASSGATSYNVLRTTNSNCSTGLSQIGTSATTTYSDTTATAGTIYYYVVQAVNACGTSGNSNCANAVRSAVPAAPAAPTVTDACTGLTVSWAAVSGATSYNVYRRANGCGSNQWNSVRTGETGTTWTDTGAALGSTYGYYVESVNACGTAGSYSNCSSGTHTLQTPAAPTGLSATGTCTAVDLSWTASSGATSYEIWRTTNSNCTTGAASIGTSATTTYSDTSAVAGTTYYYTVKAVNTCGTSGISNCANAVRLATPAAPTGLSATGTCTAVDLSWTASSGATSYNILRTTNSNCSTGLSQIGTSATTTYSDTTATAGTTYYYVVQAVNACGTSGNSNCANAVRSAVPAAPTGVAATDNRCTDVQVTWTAVTGATSYNVLRGTTCGTVVNTFTGVTSPYTDTSAVAGTTYQYWVVAVNACGTSANSACDAGVRLAAPAAPTGVAATDNRCTDVQVTWTAVTGATSYNVLRGTTCGTVVATFTGVTSPYTDTSAVAGTTYQYWVVAVNACGTSGNSTCDAGVRLAVPAAPAAPTYTNVSCTTLTVNWTAVSGATAYDLYRRSGGCGAGSVIASNLAGTTYDDSGLTASATYGYYLVAKNTCGSSAGGACAAVTTTSVPAAPTGLTATGTCAAVDLAWTASAGATSYEIWRTTNSNCNTGMTNIGTSGVNAYSDASAVAGTTYYYEVRAVNECGTSGDSNCANAARLTVPGAPSITGITDESACAQSGIRVAYTGGSGATSHDLYRDGALAVSGYISNALYNPGDTASHGYVVRAVNACGTTDSGSQNFSDVNNSTTPTIAGPNANACPDATVTLATEAGMSSYQWYIGGSPIGGATASTYVAGATGTYTVSYTNASGCTGTSAGHTVTITACAPNVQVDGAFDPLTTLAEVCGDGDGYIEPGEQWTVRVRLANTGNLGAATVQADLAINAGSQVIAVISGNSGQYGDIAAGGTALTASPYYQFEVPTGVVCPKDLVFDVVNIRSTGYTYASGQPALTVQVGAVISENALLATTPLTALGGAATSNLSPAFTLASPEAAVLAYDYSHTAGGGTTTLFGPDDTPGDSASWTRTSFDSQSEAHCTYSDAHARSGATTGSLELANAVSTVGYTGITVRFAYRHTKVPGGPPQYGTLTLDWYDGTTWTNAAWTSAQTETWVCDQQVVLPAGAEGKAGFKVRFRHSSNAAGKYSHVDYVRIEGTGAGSGDWTNNVQVELIDPSATATVLKGYGAADANPYNVLAYYTGAGTYRVRITESAGGTATLTTPGGEGMTVTLSECDTTNCGGAPPEEVDPTTPKFADKDTLAWAAVDGADGYRVYRGILEELPDLLLDGAGDSCQADVGAATVWDISSHTPPEPGRLYWYLITAYNGAGEGAAGYASGPTARVLNPSGSCP